MNAIFPIVYAGNINYFSQLKNCSAPLFDLHEHFIKQTYRNRCSIYGANGKLDLIIPVEKGKEGHRAMKDVKISYAQDWQKLHWRSLESAYRSSPYFEYYEHNFIAFYEEKTESLTDFNLKMHGLLCKLLDIETKTDLTTAYVLNGIEDKRALADPLVKLNSKFNSYTQVFETRHGFIENLSVLDLLFNCGPESSAYL